MANDTELVRLDIDRGIATITLDSQHNRNALSRQLLEELHRALDQAEEAAARAIVLTHAGPAFCSGADLRERSAGPPDSGPMVAALERLMDTERPTIAAVRGAVRAGGIGLMASCDLVVVDTSVDFALTEVRIGVAPAIIAVPILRRVAPGRIAEKKASPKLPLLSALRGRWRETMSAPAARVRRSGAWVTPSARALDSSKSRL